jgi:hypothetical protein
MGKRHRQEEKQKKASPYLTSKSTKHRHLLVQPGTSKVARDNKNLE